MATYIIAFILIIKILIIIKFMIQINTYYKEDKK